LLSPRNKNPKLAVGRAMETIMTLAFSAGLGMVILGACLVFTVLLLSQD
jgi:hypothetical protein